MFVVGFLDRLLLSASLTAYGVLFLPVCLLTAVWIRPGDLLTAPIAVPIAFAFGLLVVADGGEGFGGHSMGLLTALATQAGWLYGGTLITGVTVLARRMRLRTRLRTRLGAQAGPRTETRMTDRSGRVPGRA